MNTDIVLGRGGAALLYRAAPSPPPPPTYRQVPGGVPAHCLTRKKAAALRSSSVRLSGELAVALEPAATHTEAVPNVASIGRQAGVGWPSRFAARWFRARCDGDEFVMPPVMHTCVWRLYCKTCLLCDGATAGMSNVHCPLAGARGRD